MALFRKKISFEDLWSGLIGELLKDPIYENDAFLILFPQYRLNLGEHKKRDILNESTIPIEEFLKFKRIVYLLSVVGGASWEDTDVFDRFSGIANNVSLRDDFFEHGINLNEIADKFALYFRSGNLSPKIGEISYHSDIYGDITSMKYPQRNIFATAHVGLSVAQKYFEEENIIINTLINSHIEGSRDSMVFLFSAAQRLRVAVSKQFKPV